MPRWIKTSLELERIHRLEADKNVPGLISELTGDPSYCRFRVYAADALGRLGDKRAVPYLAELAKDPDVEARQSALLALRKLNARDGASVFLASLSDPAPTVRMTAARSLGRLGSPAEIPDLRRVLNADRDAEVRLAAAEALVELGDEDVFQQLGQVLRDVSWRIRRHPDLKRLRRLAEIYSN